MRGRFLGMDWIDGLTMAGGFLIGMGFPASHFPLNAAFLATGAFLAIVALGIRLNSPSSRS